jgi:hypothetical protein
LFSTLLRPNENEAALSRILLAALGLIVVVGSGCGGSDAPPPRAPADGIEALDVPKPVMGIAEPNAWRRVPPPATVDEIAGQVAALGATSQRFVVDWGVIEPEPPDGRHHYQFALFDAMYAADLRHGIRPLLVALNAPAWASDPGTIAGSFANNPPATSRLADWQDFLRAVAERYPRALGIEIWNEPNLATFWGAGREAIRPDPGRYTQLLSASYDAIKSVNPPLLVVGGALSGSVLPTPQGNIPARAFARAMFADGAAAYMDAISLHPYPSSGGIAQMRETIDGVRRARDEIGAPTPLWLTEMGVSTTGPYAVSEAEQANELVALCRAASREPGVEAVYIHNLIEQTERVAASEEHGFGLLRPLAGGGLVPKPAFAAMQRALSAPQGCATAP